VPGSAGFGVPLSPKSEVAETQIPTKQENSESIFSRQ